MLAFVLRWRARLSSTRAGVVLVYHRVGGRTPGDEDVEVLPTVADADFERELHHLRRHYRIVEAGDILEAVRRRKRGRRFPVAITFDDDLASHVRSALPALGKADATGTFFVGGTSLHGPHSFWWDDLQRAVDAKLIDPETLPHVDGTDVRAALDRTPRAILDLVGKIVRLTPSQRDEVVSALREAVGPPPTDSGLQAADISAIAESGSTIGFHTLGHEVLPSLADADLERALSEGREALADAAGAEVDVIAYPHGKADGRVAAAARTAGFRAGFTTARGLTTPTTDPLLIPRTVADLSPTALARRLARLFPAG